MTHQRALCVHLKGKTLLKAKTRQGLITCASPCLIQQMVQHNIFTDCLNWRSPIRARVKRQHTYSLEKSFSCKGFLSSSESKTLEKYNSQYPSANDLVQKFVSNKQQTWSQPWLQHARCNTSGIKRKQTSVKNPHSECYTGAYSWSLHVMHNWYQWLESVKTSDINVYPNRQ